MKKTASKKDNSSNLDKQDAEKRVFNLDDLTFTSVDSDKPSKPSKKKDAATNTSKDVSASKKDKKDPIITNILSEKTRVPEEKENSVSGHSKINNDNLSDVYTDTSSSETLSFTQNEEFKDDTSMSIETMWNLSIDPDSTPVASLNIQEIRERSKKVNAVQMAKTLLQNFDTSKLVYTKTGKLDMRYKINKEYVKLKEAAEGNKDKHDLMIDEVFEKLPKKKDGTLDMRYKVNKDYVKALMQHSNFSV